MSSFFTCKNRVGGDERHHSQCDEANKQQGTRSVVFLNDEVCRCHNRDNNDNNTGHRKLLVKGKYKKEKRLINVL